MRWLVRPALICTLGVSSLGCDAAPEKAPSAPADRPRKEPTSARCRRSAPFERVPLRVGEFCLDEGVDARRFGAGGAERLDAACSLFFECESTESFGLERVDAFDYVSTRASSVRVRVAVAEFSRGRSAYASFTRRVIDADGSTEFRPVEGEGRIALGPEWLLLWRGRRLVQIEYVAEGATEREAKRARERVLPELGRALAHELGGDTTEPEEMSWFPPAELEPFGVRFEDDRFLELGGTGPHVVAFSKKERGARRRVAFVRNEESGAKDLIHLFARERHGHFYQDKTFLGVRRTRAGHAPESWYLTRVGRVVLAVGPFAGAGPDGEHLDRTAHDELVEFAKRVRATPPR